ncbi:MAG: hypothetical protein GX346_07250 [Clostridiales bacterium]|nr:hypothetical protein [Clostridiales bacterium]
MKEMIVSVCLVSVATAIFKMLVPENSFKKQISFLIACFFAISLMSIFTKGKFEVDFSSEAFNQQNDFLDISKRVNDKAYRELGEKLADKIKILLDEEGIKTKQILINVNIPNLYSISISEVRLVFDNPQSQDAQKAKEVVQNFVGEDIKVSVIG